MSPGITMSGAMGAKDRQIIMTNNTWAKCLPKGSHPGLLYRRIPMITASLSLLVASLHWKSQRLSMWKRVSPRRISMLKATDALIMMYCVKNPLMVGSTAATTFALPAGSRSTSTSDWITVPEMMDTRNTLTSKNHAMRSSWRMLFTDQVKEPSKNPRPVKSGGRRLAMIMSVAGRSEVPSELRYQGQSLSSACFSIITGPNLPFIHATGRTKNTTRPKSSKRVTTCALDFCAVLLCTLPQKMSRFASGASSTVSVWRWPGTE
mmetsp:Transcript_60330/g.121045  ORF Transcript_60330/g.121045 Transcript_60330/m.121045 type:complete len:263 (-) Transcript_60330:836-1624(-)